MQRYDVAIIGGGIIGMASAMALLRRDVKSLIVLEGEDHLAAHQSGHNSGVIHSGLYYKPGSLKARLCTAGCEEMYRFCAQHSIAHERCGKIVLATNEGELVRLDTLEERGRRNGLTGLRQLPAGEIRDYEPNAAGTGALLVPDTGIVDFAEVTRAMAEVVGAQGGQITTGARVQSVDSHSDGITLQAGDEITCGSLLNCAGLHADRVARVCGETPDCRIIPFRGEFYELTKLQQSFVRNLIYPVPDPRLPFLGVHYTRMIQGGVEAGPNAVLAWSRHGYRRGSINLRDSLGMLAFSGFWQMAGRHWRTGLTEMARSHSKSMFTRALQRLTPGVTLEDLRPGRAGVRAQAVDRKGRLIDDFRIIHAGRMVHVLNAPSPAATASISIGEHIAQLLVGNS